jgi:hypothetical protein
MQSIEPSSIPIDRDVPFIESRGRPVSPEYGALVKLRANSSDSFTSKKSRDSLYQIARNLGFRVTIMYAGEDGWRVWKRGNRDDPYLLAERDARRRLQRQKRARKRRKSPKAKQK